MTASLSSTVPLQSVSPLRPFSILEDVDAVEEVAELAHLLGLVLVARDDLVDGVQDDAGEAGDGLRAPHDDGRELLEAAGVAAQVPEVEVPLVLPGVRPRPP